MNRSILGVMLIVLSIGLAFWLITPKVTDLRDLATEAQAKEQIQKNKEARRDALRELATSFSTQTDRIDRIISALPPQPEIPDVLVSIEALASESGVTFESIVPQISQRNQEVLVSIVGKGDLGALERFMRLVAENNRPMSISTLSLVKPQSDNNLSVSLTIRVPFIDATKTRITQ